MYTPSVGICWLICSTLNSHKSTGTNIIQGSRVDQEHMLASIARGVRGHAPPRKFF